MALMFPKSTKKPKRKAWGIARRKKRIATRSTFKEFGKNPGKTYRRKFTDAEVMARAVECRERRLASPTDAELAMEAILSRLGVKFEREVIVLNGDRWVLLDFLIKSVNLVVEIDGFGHKFQKRYDHQRTLWLAKKGYNVIRFWNAEVMENRAEDRDQADAWQSIYP